MFPYLHRINTLEQLLDISGNYGIEFDVRDSQGRMIITHDPFTDGIDLDVFLKYVGNRPCIVNIKSAGIEPYVLEELNKAGITDFFFLDCSFPMIIKLSNMGCKNIAVRFSEYEGIDTIFALEGRVQWVWVDSFFTLTMTKEIAEKLHESGFKLCLVSPELQGRALEVPYYKQLLQDEDIKLDAVCSKKDFIHWWLY